MWALDGPPGFDRRGREHFIESGGLIPFVMQEKRGRVAIDVGESSRQS